MKTHNYEDTRAAAAKRLPKILFEFIDGAAGDEITHGRNREDFRRLALTQRVGEWVPRPRLETTVLGTHLSMPVVTAPTGGLRLVHPRGDLAMAEAAAAARSAHTLASGSGFALEDVADQGGNNWFQLYKFTNRTIMEALVHRARDAGFIALVVTLDTAIAGRREKDLRNGFSLNLQVNLRNAMRFGPQMMTRLPWFLRYVADGMPRTMANTAPYSHNMRALSLADMGKKGAESFSPTWSDVMWIRENWRGPLAVKGILSPDDARRAVDLGVDGVVVSNHGGRQLDGVPSSISALPAIVEAVGDRTEVLLDSGIRRGGDVIKALALGARAVLVGRLPIWGLALDGARGAHRSLEMLRDEMIATMCLMGCGNVHDLGPQWITE